MKILSFQSTFLVKRATKTKTTELHTVANPPFRHSRLQPRRQQRFVIMGNGAVRDAAFEHSAEIALQSFVL